MPKNLIWENNQTITFTSIAGKASTAAPFTVTATATSSLPVKFTSNTPTICTVTADVVTMVGATGTASISANQMGNNTYYPAPEVIRTFAVT